MPHNGMPRIAIASCHDIKNYGSMLQAFATQQFFEDRGYEVKTIDKRGMSGAIAAGRRSYYARNLANVQMYLEKSPRVAKMLLERTNREFREEMRQRNAAFDSFSECHFKLTKRAFSFEELSSLSRQYDVVVVGSDQNWLPVNISGGYYTLEWVDSHARKISIATSFGLSSLSDEYLSETRRFLSSFDAISVREETGASIVQQATSLRPEVICDPTMLLTKERWADVMDRSYRPVDMPYIFCYFLGRNRWQRELVRNYAEARGLVVVAVTQIDSYQAYDGHFADVTPWDIGPDRWLSLVANASLVCTDSFHGTVFSNIFGVPFVSFRRHEGGVMSTNSRLDTLLRRLGESYRICESKEDFESIASLGAPTAENYDALAAFREVSSSWICNAVGTDTRFGKTRAVDIVDKEDCCGCGACAAICPVECIRMEYDADGCEYPSVDHTSCLECGRCARACPVLAVKPEQAKPQNAFLVQHKDQAVLLESTSGGAVTAFAQAVLRDGGIVFGAGYLDETRRSRAHGAPGRLVVGHFGVDNEGELWRFRNSKYVQSSIGPTYREVRDELGAGREVLFIGTPCQCEGLLSFLGSRPEGLRIVDVVCRATVCRSVFSAYVSWLDAHMGEADEVRFRDKSRYGYNYSHLRAIRHTKHLGVEELYSAGVETDPYLRAFFANLDDRPSCYHCSFKKRYRESDLTCWDCFDVSKYSNTLDNNGGVTRVLVHTEAGQALLERAAFSLRTIEIDVEDAIEGVREMVRPVDANPMREAFMQDVACLSPDELVSKWLPDSVAVKAERAARRFAQKTGAYNTIKRAVKKVLGR